MCACMLTIKLYAACTVSNEICVLMVTVATELCQPVK